MSIEKNVEIIITKLKDEKKIVTFINELCGLSLKTLEDIKDALEQGNKHLFTGLNTLLSDRENLINEAVYANTSEIGELIKKSFTKLKNTKDRDRSNTNKSLKS